jgi:hypothetical protein
MVPDASGSGAADTPVLVESAPEFPDGFEDAGNGLALRFMETSAPEFDCSYLDSCSVVELFSYSGCPSGGYIEANILNGAGTIVDYTNDSIPSMGVGDRYNSVLGSMGNGSGLTTKITELTCY